MGVQGLLLALKPYACVGCEQSGNGSNGNIRDYKNQNVAIDTSSWLHKSVYSIADQYVENVVEKHTLDQRCIEIATEYIYKRCIELIKYANIANVYLVLDGKRCPLKAITNQDREMKRQMMLEQARKHKKSKNMNAMYEKYKACIKITNEFTKAVIQKLEMKMKKGCASSNLHQRNIHIVWSPYEADAQLVQLILDGRAHVVITEDSDVLLYSASCNISFPILYKLDRNNGHCDVYTMDWLLSNKSSLLSQQDQPYNVDSTKNSKKKVDSGLRSLLSVLNVRQQQHYGMGSRLFIQACILTGCDYAPTRLLNGIGFVTALKYVCNTIHRDSNERITHIINQQVTKKCKQNIQNVIMDCTKTDTIHDLLMKCEAVFYYHPVINENKQVVYLNGHPNITATATTTAAIVTTTATYEVTKNTNSSTTDENVDTVNTDQQTKVPQSTYDYRPNLLKYPSDTWSIFLGELQKHDATLLDQLKQQHHHQINQSKFFSSSTTNKTLQQQPSGVLSTNYLPKNNLMNDTEDKRKISTKSSTLMSEKQYTARSETNNKNVIENPYKSKSSNNGNIQYSLNQPTKIKNKQPKYKQKENNETKNMFERYSYKYHHDQDENKENQKEEIVCYDVIDENTMSKPTKSSSILESYRCHTSKDDIRFVKRDFPIDGSRTLPLREKKMGSFLNHCRQQQVASPQHHSETMNDHRLDHANVNENTIDDFQNENFVSITNDSDGFENTKEQTQTKNDSSNESYSSEDLLAEDNIETNFQSYKEIQQSTPLKEISRTNTSSRFFSNSNNTTDSSPESLSFDENYFQSPTKSSKRHKTKISQDNLRIRRVTLEGPTTLTTKLGTLGADKSGVIATKKVKQFKLYDDFLDTPPKATTHEIDEIVDESPGEENNFKKHSQLTSGEKQHDAVHHVIDANNTEAHYDGIENNDSFNMYKGTTTMDEKKHSPKRKSFKFYDSPAEKSVIIDLSMHEDIEVSGNDQEESELPYASISSQTYNMLSQRKEPPKIYSSIGPAKTLRNRFVPNTSTNVFDRKRRHSTIENAFLRQEQMSAASLTQPVMDSKSSRLSNTSGGRSSFTKFLENSKKRKREALLGTKNTASILSHFTRRVSPPILMDQDTI